MELTHRTVGWIVFALAISMVRATSAAPADGHAAEKHWAFQPIHRPELPAVSDPAWSGNPVDRFVMAKMATPRDSTRRRGGSSDIDPAALSRPDRSAADAPMRFGPSSTTGRRTRLPGWSTTCWPARNTASAGAALARSSCAIAETNGYERDGAKPNAWRYRDYVIDALNRDKPYDRFLTEQLAGDEMEGSDATAQIATTFLRLGTWDDEPAEPMVDRYDQLDDVLGTAATAFLGITLRCARCHDHKFEPFSQVDYYRMLAVFEPLKRPQNGRTDLDRPVGTEAELAAYRASDRQDECRISTAIWARVEGLIRPEIDRLLAPVREQRRTARPKGKPTVAATRCGRGVSDCSRPNERQPSASWCRQFAGEARGRGPGDRA